jgi:hypothetical protein
VLNVDDRLGGYALREDDRLSRKFKNLCGQTGGLEKAPGINCDFPNSFSTISNCRDFWNVLGCAHDSARLRGNHGVKPQRCGIEKHNEDIVRAVDSLMRGVEEL